jgi:xanthine dehydrogenase YagR molybdenum-binding subunit
VKVDSEFGRIHAARLVGALAAERIVNPRLVRSQYRGVRVWGVSFALHERAVTEAAVA